MKKIGTALFVLLVMNIALYAQDSTVFKIWPNAVPGETGAKHAPKVTDDHSNNVIRLTDVTDPDLTVFRPEKPDSGKAAVIICPGGGYKILAVNLEGYEIAHWLNSLGITAFVLKYRVPDKEPGALQDAQRAIRVVRENAQKWDINPQKVGILGFSAGGSLSARLSTEFDKKLYENIDKADDLTARPDFSVLIYPAYLDRGPDHTLTPELNINEYTPPMFIFQTADDPYGHSSLVMAENLRAHHIPVEFHLYPKGGHGYGLRKNNPAGKVWPGLAAEWLKETMRSQEQ